MQAISSRSDLQNFVRSLNTEICRVWEHWNLLSGILDLWDRHPQEFNQSSQFWRITTRALQDMVIVRLAAFLDDADNVVSLPNLLRILKKQGDPGSGNLKVIGITQTTLDELGIEGHLRQVDRNNPLVHTVRTLRNKIIAHRDMSIVVRNALEELPVLLNADIGGLIDRLYKIVYTYCDLVEINPILKSFPGADDYRNLFKLLSLGFAEISKQTDRDGS